MKLRSLMPVCRGICFIVLFVCVVILVACPNQGSEKEFFSKYPASARMERLRTLPIEEQYRLFRYGNDKMEPPLMGLAEPIAERGKSAVPFLLEKLNGSPDDITVRDVLLVFDTMGAIRAYDVKSDSQLITVLRSQVSAMKDAEWKAICMKTIRSIETN